MAGQDSTIQPPTILNHIRHIYYFTDAATTITDNDTYSWLQVAERTLALTVVVFWFKDIRFTCFPGNLGTLLP
ncbi:hypothetical protein ES703_119419 [subsurface metagenome]